MWILPSLGYDLVETYNLVVMHGYLIYQTLPVKILLYLYYDLKGTHSVVNLYWCFMDPYSLSEYYSLNYDLIGIHYRTQDISALWSQYYDLVQIHCVAKSCQCYITPWLSICDYYYYLILFAMTSQKRCIKHVLKYASVL